MLKTTSLRKAKKRKQNSKSNCSNKEVMESKWIVNISSYLLSTTQHIFHQKGLNYNIDDANQLEFLAALEVAFKTTGLAIETQENMRQTIMSQTRRIQQTKAKPQYIQKAEVLLENKDIYISVITNPDNLIKKILTT